MDAAHELLARIDARAAAIDDIIAELGDERDRLADLRASLARFMEQPGREVELGAPRTPASQPEAGGSPPAVAPPAPEQPPAGGERRPRAGRHGEPDSATTRPPTAVRPRSEIVACPECGEEVRRQGLGVHRRKSKRHAAAINARAREIVGVKPRQRRAATPKTGTPATRNGAVMCPTCKDWFVSAEILEAHRATRHGYRAGQATESFLCSRCPEAFPTRAERDEHQATHPAEPVDRLVGRDPHATRHTPAGVQIA